MPTITKVGLAVRGRGTVLLVRKRGTRTLILPGGKPIDGEGDQEALRREISEELGCYIQGEMRFLGEFCDVAADLLDTDIIVRLYEAKLSGEPRASSEIDQLYWYALDGGQPFELAPSLKNYIIPFLSTRATETVDC